MNWGRTSARSPSATYSINSTSYTSPVATSYSSHHTPSYSSHITSYSSRGNLYPYHGTSFSSNESIRTNNNGDNRIPQVLAFYLGLLHFWQITDILVAGAKESISGPSFGTGSIHHKAAN